MTFLQKVKHLEYGLILLIATVSGIGFTALYSAAGGSFDPWATNQIIRFSGCFVIMLIVAFIDIYWWHKLSYLAFWGGFVLLLIVEIKGHVGMGAQRWINLGVINLQPSELMKIAVVMALARYFHMAGREDTRRLLFLIVPALIIALPVLLVMSQPDLGTSLMIIMAGASVFFVAGVPIWIFIAGIVLALSALPIFWHLIDDYQKQRVLTFLNPESDPLNTGYHIIQSKIALGSGGMEGKGFLQGTQSKLNFLPEKQTDFIFTLWSEEWGLIGGAFLLFLFLLIFFYMIRIAMKCRHGYGKLLVMGLCINFSVYVFVNTAMVMGVIPVVGAPLPLVSYGGSVMLSTMIGFGLVMSCSIHHESKLAKMK